jgi:hypothetical protein
MLDKHTNQLPKDPAAALVRWLLFLPAGLASGIALFSIFIFWTMWSADSDIAYVGFYIGGVAGGMCSVFVALHMAPSHSRIVAAIMAIVCLTLATVLIWWAKVSHKDLFIFIVPAAIYSIGAVVTAWTIIRAK